ncbi:hypothetical protein [Aquibacillus halophilus]|nr:hypothetical protein [Aquibacillus halophilus]
MPTESEVFCRSGCIAVAADGKEILSKNYVAFFSNRNNLYKKSLK